MKLLSSGVTKGAVASTTLAGGSNRSEIIDPARKGDPANFWTGYRLTLLDARGQTFAEGQVRRFDARRGRLLLDRPLAVEPEPGQVYELCSDEYSPVVAIRYLLGLGLGEAVPPVVVRLGTTRGTNALITRRGARTALITTRGFGDVLRIGYQNRPKLFELAITKLPPLFAKTVEIDERITTAGEVLIAPQPDVIRRQLSELREEPIDSLAICFLHSHQHPRHELLVEQLAREAGFEEISVSSRVAPLIKIVARGDTTVMDAYLNPVLRGYVNALRRSLSECDLRILTSAGGLVEAEKFVGKDSILSGPAGGVVGFSRIARAAGFDRAIGFDMGGTSTDVSRFDGRWELEYETEKAGVRVVAPMMAIETVAAGGGSICHFDSVKLAVGPDSAGADPGPACYARGGPLAVTDINFFLGKILPEHFPFPLDRSAVESRLADLCQQIDRVAGTLYTPAQLADGFLRVANANMVKAIRSISIAKGCDPRDYVLVAFGGAAAQHSCAVARELGMRQVLNHPDAGILSAYGIGMADITRHGAAGVYRPYDESQVQSLEPLFARLTDEARREVLAEGVPEHRIEVRRLLDLRYQGFDAYLTIEQPAGDSYADAYAVQHEKLYGYVHHGRSLEIVAVRVEVVGRSADEETPSRSAREQTPTPEGETTMIFDARQQTAKIYDRTRLVPGDRLSGPAIVYETTSTTIIDPGWHCEVLTAGELLLNDSLGQQRVEASAEADPVMLEIFNNQFAGIASQMGITLRNTSSSVNVKERLDFSCAVFTADGDLVVNAPHIPVHLGAMSETVKGIIADNSPIRPGDVFVTNDPYRGGSHLPDVTVITPVHQGPDELVFFTASRAHHAEIGGILPGSMPPFSKNLAEEGVLIRNFKLVDAGSSRIEALRELLTSAEYPTRSVEENLADITAQTAANNQGAADLIRLTERYSLKVTLAYMRHIQSAAEQKMRQALARFPDGTHRFTDHLDDGSPISVAVTIAGEQATIDFTGTGPVLSGNLNANRAIVSAAMMYCLRLLIDEDIPLNQGVMAPVTLVLPECLLNPPVGRTPAESAAMVGGNVETSQRVVDVLLGALGTAAASQGTMNNVLFGDETFGYYETICGGSGATARQRGADAVHTHMTNTRLTDPEVLEQRYPVRVREFSIRRGTGGAGKFRGGDGVFRQLEMLRRLDVSILSQRRGDHRPYGLQGGQPGAAGVNTLIRADGSREPLGGQVQFEAQAGDVLQIETPGGGGFGMPDEEEQ